MVYVVNCIVIFLWLCMLSSMFDLNMDVMVNIRGKLVKFPSTPPSQQEPGWPGTLQVHSYNKKNIK